MKDDVGLFSALQLNFLKPSVKKQRKKLIKIMNFRILVAAFGNMIGIFLFGRILVCDKNKDRKSNILVDFLYTKPQRNQITSILNLFSA